MLSEFLCGCVVLLVLWWWVTWLWSRRHLYALSRNLPGPRALPIIGNAIQLGCMGNHRKLIPNIKRMMDQYGGIFRVWFGPVFMICIQDAEDYEAILTSKLTFNRGFMYDMVKYALNDGLFSASGNTWKKHRHIINPAFAISTLKRYQKKHNYYAVKMVESMKHILNQGLVDVGIYPSRFIADLVCDCFYEFEPKCYTGLQDDILRSSHRAPVILHERMCRFWLHSDIIYERSQSHTEYAKVFRDYCDFFHPRFLNKFHECVNELKTNNQTLEKAESHDNLEADYILEDNSDAKNRSIMKILAESYVVGDLTIQEAINEFGNVFIPALDTTSNQLNTFMLMMGMHRRVQNKLWEEISEFYSHDMDAEVTGDHLSQLPYLDMVLKETMRCFPSGPMQCRRLEEDFYMKHRDVTLPAGTQILLINILLHKNEKYWKNPMEFYPERFSPEESAKRHHFAFIPYSVGLRNCIGQVFASDAIKTAAIHLMRKFEFSADPSWTMEGLSLLTDVSTRVEASCKVNIRRREGKLTH